MISISLHQLRFSGFHGCYEEEKKLGNEFEVNLELWFEEPVQVIQDLDHSINYETIYQLVDKRMKKATPLLETIAMEIGTQIKEQFPQVMEIRISIEKVRPVIVNLQGQAGITYHKKFVS